MYRVKPDKTLTYYASRIIFRRPSEHTIDSVCATTVSVTSDTYLFRADAAFFGEGVVACGHAMTLLYLLAQSVRSYLYYHSAVCAS